MTAHVHLYDRRAPIGHIYFRVFEPRSFVLAAPRFGVPAVIGLPPTPPCAVCGVKAVPGLLNWIDVFGDDRIFTVCSACAAVPEDELEQILFARFGLLPPASSRVAQG
jgi:hypothetical protein